MYTNHHIIESGGIFPDPSTPQSKKDFDYDKECYLCTRILANLTKTMTSQSDILSLKHKMEEGRKSERNCNDTII